MACHPSRSLRSTSRQLLDCCWSLDPAVHLRTPGSLQPFLLPRFLSNDARSRVSCRAHRLFRRYDHSCRRPFSQANYEVLESDSRMDFDCPDHHVEKREKGLQYQGCYRILYGRTAESALRGLSAFRFAVLQLHFVSSQRHRRSLL